MTQRRDLQALIDAAPVGKMQWRVIICCFLVVMLDGFDTAAIGFIAPDIRTHWQLTAGDLAPLFGAGLLGLTAGALLCGPLSDRFGRKRVIELCVFLFGALSLASAFSPDLQTLVFLRFLTGLGLGGAMPNTITMTSEYLPARRRGALVTLMFCGFTLGSAVGGIVSAQLVPVIGWHGILVLGGVLPLMLFVALTFALAALVNFTGFRETWTFGSLLVILSVSSLALGMMEGRIFQKRGLLAGGAAAVFFLAIILVSVQGLFAEEFSLGKTGWLYLISVAAGSLGGICGVNHKT